MNNPSKVNEFIITAPIIFVRDAFYVFGGTTDISSYDTTIGKLDADLIWTKVGDLSKGRLGHNVIFDGNYAYVVGGFAVDQQIVDLPTEKWDLSSSAVNCTEQSPLLYGYNVYPELFIVPPNFCKT